MKKVILLIVFGFLWCNFGFAYDKNKLQIPGDIFELRHCTVLRDNIILSQTFYINLNLGTVDILQQSPNKNWDNASIKFDIDKITSNGEIVTKEVPYIKFLNPTIKHNKKTRLSLENTYVVLKITPKSRIGQTNIFAPETNSKEAKKRIKIKK